MAETASSVSEESERRDRLAGLGSSNPNTLLGRIRTRSSSRGRTSDQQQQQQQQDLYKMSSSATSPSREGGQHHHGGALDKLKGVFSNRPSSRDRFSGREDGSERGTSLHTTQTNGTTVDGERGRHMHKDGDYIVSTGRGGAGNLRAASRTRGPEANEPTEEELRERSRERSRERGLVGGRGGAGNFRSASKQPADRIRERLEEEEAEKEERAAQEKRAAIEANQLKSHGRGGAGNIK